MKPTLNAKTKAIRSPAQLSLTSNLDKVKIWGCCVVNPITRNGRRFYLVQMVLLPFIPIMALIVQNCSILNQQTVDVEAAEQIFAEMTATIGIAELLKAVQIERNLAFYQRVLTYERWETTSSARVDDLQNQLRESYNATDAIVSQMYTWEWKRDYGDIQEVTMQNLKSLLAFRSIFGAIENLCIASCYSLKFYETGHLVLFEHNEFIKYISVAMNHFEQIRNFSSRIDQVEPKFDELTNHWHHQVTINATLHQEHGSARYYSFMLDMIDKLHDLQTNIKGDIEFKVRIEMDAAKRNQTISIGLLILVLFVSPVIIFLVKYTTNTIQNFANHLVERTNELRMEKQKCDKLLYSMLPMAVVKQLKLQRQVPAETFESVTIFFSDIVDFTRLSAMSSAKEVIAMLNVLYQLFDSRIQKYEVYKVETIGDSYMVVSGLPQRNGNKHAGEIAIMSLDLLHAISGFSIPHQPDETLKIRIGINTGPCVAGVVGTSMPRYCLFGDTINTASRMESTSEAMKIQISDSTKKQLDILGGYHIQKRKQMEIKGKGAMDTHWLLGHASMDPAKLVSLNTIREVLPTIFMPEFMQIIDNGFGIVSE